MRFLQCGSWFSLMILSYCRDFIRIPYHLSKVIYKLLGISRTWLVKWGLIVGRLHLVVLHAFRYLVEMVLILVAQSAWCFENRLKLIICWIHIILIHLNILNLANISLRVISYIVFYQVTSNSSLSTSSGKISVRDTQLRVLNFISLLCQMRHISKTRSLHTLLSDFVKIVLSSTYCSVILRTNIQIYHIIWRITHRSCSCFYIICDRLLARIIIDVVLKIRNRNSNMRLILTSSNKNIACIIVRTCVSSLLVIQWNICFIYLQAMGLIFILLVIVLVIVYLLNIAIIFLIILPLKSVFKTCSEFICKNWSFFCRWSFNQKLRCSDHLKSISSFLDIFSILVIKILSNLWNILSCIQILFKSWLISHCWLV